MSEYKMWIGGKWVESESGKLYPVFNPTTAVEIAQVPKGDKADVDKAVTAARAAFPVWFGKSQAERSQTGLKIAAMLRNNAKEIAEKRHWNMVHQKIWLPESPEIYRSGLNGMPTVPGSTLWVILCLRAQKS